MPDITVFLKLTVQLKLIQLYNFPLNCKVLQGEAKIFLFIVISQIKCTSVFLYRTVQPLDWKENSKFLFVPIPMENSIAIKRETNLATK